MTRSIDREGYRHRFPGLEDVQQVSNGQDLEPQFQKTKIEPKKKADFTLRLRHCVRRRYPDFSIDSLGVREIHDNKKCLSGSDEPPSEGHGLIYGLRIRSNGKVMFKIGQTSKSVDERYDGEKLPNHRYELIFRIEVPEEELGCIEEYLLTIHRLFQGFSYKGESPFRDTKTKEVFNHILDLPSLIKQASKPSNKTINLSIPLQKDLIFAKPRSPLHKLVYIIVVTVQYLSTGGEFRWVKLGYTSKSINDCYPKLRSGEKYFDNSSRQYCVAKSFKILHLMEVGIRDIARYHGRLLDRFWNSKIDSNPPLNDSDYGEYDHNFSWNLLSDHSIVLRLPEHREPYWDGAEGAELSDESDFGIESDSSDFTSSVL